MSNEVLNSLLKEYEQKKWQAELDLERRKETLYEKIPRLREIEDELNNLAIKSTKNILNGENASISELQNKINLLKIEKEKILASKNLNLNYLQPFYNCSICKDTGYIMDNTYKTHMCSCLKQRLLDVSFNKSNMNNLNKENFSTFNSNLFSNEVDFSKYNFNVSPRENILNIEKKCIEFINNFDDPNYKNLLFIGNTGLR